MKRIKKTLATTLLVTLGISGNASARMIDPEEGHFEPDATLKSCQHWDTERREHFESIFERTRHHLETRLPEHVKVRWEDKWGDRDDWSHFDHSRRPFKKFFLETHFHGPTQGNYCPPSPVPVPSAVWLFGSGLIGLVAVARRRSR